MKAPERIDQGARILWAAPDREWLKHQYHVLGKPIRQIAHEVGCHFNTARVWIAKYGLRKKREEYRRRFAKPTKQWLECQYLELDKSLRDIADELGCSTMPIRLWLLGYGIKKQSLQLAKKHSRRMAGCGNPAWSGGTSRQYQAGLLEDRPCICAWCGTKDDIQLHHKDHDRLNARLDNLEWLCGTCNRLESHLWALIESGRATVTVDDGRLTIAFKK